MTAEERTIQRDRMRFIKNSLSSNLAILGILFDVFYFVSIYKSDVNTYYYNILIGASIVYNLVFMLAVFLSSEGVKNYRRNYSYLLAAIGALQIVRIFIIPVRAHAAATLVTVHSGTGLSHCLRGLPFGGGGGEFHPLRRAGGTSEVSGDPGCIRRQGHGDTEFAAYRQDIRQ